MLMKGRNVFKHLLYVEIYIRPKALYVSLFNSNISPYRMKAGVLSSDKAQGNHPLKLGKAEGKTKSP